MATKTSPKSKNELFMEELQKLLDHYQLSLKPIIKTTELGIVPQLILVNVPPKEPMKKDKNGK